MMYNDALVATRIPAAVRESLAELARDRDRSLSGEIRHALRLYVAADRPDSDDRGARVVRAGS
jgi:hypothetical protein